MESTPLAHLPGDCWLQILEYLPQQDLNSLSRATHDTRGSVEPFLYRSIYWDWKQPPVRKILLLLRTISERPKLAQYIRHVSLVWWDVESQGTEISSPKGDLNWAKSVLQFRPTLRWARKVVRDAKFPTKFDTKWITRLFDGDAYAYATLLISQLHNLRSLRLDFSFVLEGGFPGEMLHHALFGNAPPGTLSRFSKLEMADYGSNFPLTRFQEGVSLGRTSQFIPWFHLPSLKTLELWLYSVEGICIFPAEMPKISLNLPNLRSLVIAKTRVLPGDITRLLSQLPYLKSLHVGMAYQCRATAEFLKEPECLLRSLENLGQAIEHLSISMELLPCCAESFLQRAIDDGGRPFHGMLKKFPNLKTASLPLNFLIGWDITAYRLRDVLPSTLEALHIRADLWQITNLIEFEMEALEALESLMRHKQRGSLPSLRTFSYQGQHEYNDTELAALGFEADFKYSYLIKREALNLFCHRQGYKLFSQYGDCTPDFMVRGATLVDNIVHRLPWPFVRVDELPASVPRHLRTASIKSSDQQSNDANPAGPN
ncbi:hypothetical protein PEX1_089760 [Penicillium expansum]|nr:hypothetical protein PEX1_089760 [Penicillium expansum]